LGKKLKAKCPVEEACVSSMADCEDLLRRSRVGDDGTCCCCCTIAGNLVWCSNLGDCRAGLVTLQPPVGPCGPRRAMHLTWLSRDHKASIPFEQERIRKAGGIVCNGRVEGLEPSRTLGDFDVKSQTRKGVISIVPDVRRHELCNGSELGQALLICATDGVWDVLSGQDVCNLINSRKDLMQLQSAALASVLGDAPESGAGKGAGKGPSPRGERCWSPDKTAGAAKGAKVILKDLAEDLVQFSIAKGSQDDCTAVIALITVAPRIDASRVQLTSSNSSPRIAGRLGTAQRERKPSKELHRARSLPDSNT